MTLRELLQKRAQVLEQMAALNALAQTENRDFTDEETGKWNAMDGQVKSFDAQIARIRHLEAMTPMQPAEPNQRSADPEPDAVVIQVPDQPIYRGSAAAALGQQLADIAMVETPGSVGEREARSRLEQNTNRVMSLITRSSGREPSPDFQRQSFMPLHNTRAAGTGQIQGIGSEGGFLLQSETSIDLMTHGFNNSEVLRRCQRRTITGSESVEVVGIDETSRASGSRGGGVRVYTDAELSAITSSTTKFKKIRLSPERLTGMYYASDKLLKNVVFLGQEMRQLFMDEFAFKTQDLVIEGTGAGQALGIKAADCKVTVAKETGQAADTIVSENILKMYSRFLLRSGSGSACWLTNRDCFTQLFTMTYAVGTGGELSRLYVPPSQPNGIGSMLGYPVIFIEQAETLGDLGDIWLADFSQYLVVDYGNIEEASSIHLKFDYGQTAFRFVYYFDGQPRDVSAITPFKGSATVSPFVTLAARA